MQYLELIFIEINLRKEQIDIKHETEIEDEKLCTKQTFITNTYTKYSKLIHRTLNDNFSDHPKIIVINRGYLNF